MTATGRGVAVLGAGVGAQHVDGWLAQRGRVRLRAVCDLDLERARALAARAPGCRATTCLDEVLAAADVEIVCNCLPPGLHAEITLRALAHGKHVVCEKPLATSLHDAERMRAAAQAAGRLLVPVFQYRYGRGLAQLDALRARGLAGEPLVASLELHWNRDRAYYAVPWRGTWDGEGGGALLCHAIHVHDLLYRHFDAAAEVSAFVDTRVNAIETEDCAALAIRTRSGALASSSVTLGAAGDETRLRFVYSRLTAESGRNPYAPGEDAWRFEARAPASQAEVDAVLDEVQADVAARPSGFAGQFAALLDRLDGRDTDLVAAEDGVHSIEFVSACYLAARGGERVRLPLPKRAPVRQGWAPAAPSRGVRPTP